MVVTTAQLNRVKIFHDDIFVVFITCNNFSPKCCRYFLIILSGRKWRPQPPVCQPVSCGSPPELEYGSYIIESESEPFTYNSIVKYTCDKGYKFRDGPGMINIWRDREIYIFDVQLIYTLLLLATLSNSFFSDPYTITCLWDRSWNLIPPTCVPVPCPDLSPISNGDFQASGDLVFGATVLYKCVKGFELQVITGY